jgi:hypothetical protein
MCHQNQASSYKDSQEKEFILVHEQKIEQFGTMASAAPQDMTVEILLELPPTLVETLHV